jgi:hypothetical protein
LHPQFVFGVHGLADDEPEILDPFFSQQIRLDVDLPVSPLRHQIRVANLDCAGNQIIRYFFVIPSHSLKQLGHVLRQSGARR